MSIEKDVMLIQEALLDDAGVPTVGEVMSAFGRLRAALTGAPRVETEPDAFIIEYRGEGVAGWVPFHLQRPFWNRENAEAYANEVAGTNEGAGLIFRVVALYRIPMATDADKGGEDG